MATGGGRNIGTDLAEAWERFLHDLTASPVGPALDKLGQDLTAARIFVHDAFEKTSVDVQAFATYMRPASRALDGLATGTLQAFAGAATFVTESLGLMRRVVWEATFAFGAMNLAAAAFVQASSPAEMLRFTMAMQDFAASIGVILEPIILASTQVFDVFNRLFTSLQGTIRPVIEQFGALLVSVATVLADAVRPVLVALSSYLGVVVAGLRQGFEAARPAIDAVAGMLTNLITALQPLVQQAIPYAVSTIKFFADAVADAADFIVGLTTREGLSAAAPSLIENVVRISAAASAGPFGLLLNQMIPALNAASTEAVIAAGRAARPDMPPLSDSGITVAARQPQMIGIEQLGEQARLAAFGARTSADRDEERNRLLRQIEHNTAGAVLTPFGWATVNQTNQAAQQQQVAENVNIINQILALPQLGG